MDYTVEENPLTNKSVLGHDLTDSLPQVPELSGDVAADLLIMRLWAIKMKTAFTDIISAMNTRANVGFLSAVVGANSILSSGDGVLTITDDGGSSVTISGSAINIASFTLLSEMSGDLDDIDDGLFYDRVATANVDGGHLVILDQCSGNVDFSSQVDGAQKPENNATEGSDWSVDLSNIPTRFTNSIPGSGAGLIATADAMGYYRAGKKITEEWSSGTFVVGEKVVQATTNAAGIVTEVNQTGTDYLVVDVLTGAFGAANVITGQTSGATVTPSHAGDITAYTTMGMLITSSGVFYFGGDGNNYIAWDGTNINIVCAGGYIGSATDYFNISTGVFRSSVDASNYIEIDSGVFDIVSAAGALKLSSSIGGIYAEQYQAGFDVELDTYDTNTAASSHIFFQKSHSATKAFVTTIDGEELGEIRFCGTNKAADAFTVGVQILAEQVGDPAGAEGYVTGKLSLTTWNDNSTVYVLTWSENNFDLTGGNLVNAVLAAASGCTIDASLITGGTLGAAVCSINASNIDAGTMDGARVSGGTFGAVIGSALTALNATNLGSGTVPDARFPADAVGIKCGSYTGAAGDVDVSLGSGNAALHVEVKRADDTRYSIIGSYDGSNMHCWKAADNPKTDQPILQHADGFTVKATGDWATLVNVDTKTFYYTAWYALN